MKAIIVAALILAAPPPYIDTIEWDRNIPQATVNNIKKSHKIAYHYLRHGENTKKFFKDNYGLETEIFFEKPVYLRIRDCKTTKFSAMQNYPEGIKNITVNWPVVRNNHPNKLAALMLHELAHYAGYLDDGINDDGMIDGVHEGNIAEWAFWADCSEADYSCRWTKRPSQ